MTSIAWISLAASLLLQSATPAGLLGADPESTDAATGVVFGTFVFSYVKRMARRSR